MKRKALFMFIAVLALMLVMAVPAFADSYDYTVTVDGGLYGTVTGTTTDSFDYGEQWNPNDYTVAVTDSKYYFKGFHRAGQEGVLEGAQKIEEDVDFVASFGIVGDQVKYTVNFVDASGGTLAASKEFYGNVGDKPVVAYVYVEGYQPQAYNLTKTLVTDESQNVFTFTYTEWTPIEETTVVPGEGGGAATGGGAAAGTTGGEGTAAGAGTATGGEGAAAGGGTAIDNGTTPAGTPADVIDLDDNDTPTSDTPGEGEDGEDGEGDEGEGTDIDDNKTPSAAVTGGIIAAIVAAIGAGIFAVTRRKKDDN